MQCGVCKRDSYARWRNENKEYVASKIREWRSSNKDRVNELNRLSRARNKHKKESPTAKVARNMRHLVYYALRRNKNGLNWEALVGYSRRDLMEHLEGKFKPGMTWDNYGLWHVDHIRPIRSFSFTAPSDKQFLECWRLSNLQPLWASENRKKRCTWEGSCK